MNASHFGLRHHKVVHKTLGEFFFEAFPDIMIIRHGAKPKIASYILLDKLVFLDVSKRRVYMEFLFVELDDHQIPLRLSKTNAAELAEGPATGKF